MLNPPQREAVAHGDGPLLVLAGAGSGKTRVITHRVAALLERGVPAEGILAVTFTNKAAGEMRERVEGLVGKTAKKVTICTFHALGLQILKAEQRAFGFPRGFTIYDSADQLGVVREILRDVKVDDRRFDVKAILHRISRAKNALITPEAYEPDPSDDYDRITQAVYPRYQRALKTFAAVDFDDLLVETIYLLDRDAAVRFRWESRFQHLLVDEYQDTNRAQLLLLQRLARHGNVMVVGDDDQSIYAFRGAETSNILEFERHFAGARVVKLEQNYRSTPTILAAANAVIRHNSDRHAKELWSDLGRGEPLHICACGDAEAEAAFVVNEIERLRREERRRLADCAVLYRSNVQARPLEEALRERRMPYEMHGGQKFYERKEVKDVIAYLKVALNPRDEISLRRIINYPARGIGAASVERAVEWAAAHQLPLWEAFARFGEIEGASPGSKKAVAAFVDTIERARAGLRAGQVAEIAQRLVDEIGLYPDLRAAAANLTAAQRRIDNVEDLLKSVANHQADLAHYLQLLSLDGKDDDATEGGGDRITLTTLHGAKGLEWPVVFLVGVEEELLPHARTLYPQGPDLDGDADVSEERRLAYVGITRARERLYLTWARLRHRHGGDRITTPSRFLSEIPPDLCSRRDLLAEARAAVPKDEVRNFFKNWGGTGSTP